MVFGVSFSSVDYIYIYFLANLEVFKMIVNLEEISEKALAQYRRLQLMFTTEVMMKMYDQMHQLRSGINGVEIFELRLEIHDILDDFIENHSELHERDFSELFYVLDPQLSGSDVFLNLMFMIRESQV